MNAYRLLPRDIINHPEHGELTVLSAVTNETEGHVTLRVRDRSSSEFSIHVPLGADIPLVYG